MVIDLLIRHCDAGNLFNFQCKQTRAEAIFLCPAHFGYFKGVYGQDTRTNGKVYISN